MPTRDKNPELFDPGETIGFLADEERTDRRLLWRLGSWAVCAVGAVTLAVYVSQTVIEQRRMVQADSPDTTRQAQQMQSLIKESQNEANRLALAVETLNNDRDRLYARVSTLEQGLDSVTGAVNRRAAAAPAMPPDKPMPAPVQSRPAGATVDTPAPPPEPAATKLAEPNLSDSKPSNAGPTPLDVAAAEPKPEIVAALPESKLPETPAPYPHVGVDLGTAPGLEGLRLQWRRVAKAHPEAAGLQPVVAVRERPGVVGIQLRLIGGPLTEAAAMQLCASVKSTGAACEPTDYDGQKLALVSPPGPPAPKPVRRKPVPKPIQPAAAEPAPPVAVR